MLSKNEDQIIKVFGYGSIFVFLFFCCFVCIFWTISRKEWSSMPSKNPIVQTAGQIQLENMDSINKKLDLILKKLDKIN